VNSKKNILLVVVDCLSSDSVFNSKKFNALENLKKRGVSFPKTIASSTITTPCFAGLLTGCYSFKHGIKTLAGYRLNPNVPLLIRYLKDAGYYAVAEVTGPFSKQKIGFAKYFDEYNTRNEKSTVYTAWWNDFLSRIDQLKTKQPWFILLHLWELHTPRYFPKGNALKTHMSSKYDLALAFLDKKLAELVSKLDSDTLLVVTGDHGEQIEKNAVDHFLKKVINFSTMTIARKFKNNRLCKKLLIKIQKKFAVGHGFNLYDPLIKIPLIIIDNALPNNLRINKQVRQIDILPTILDIVKLQTPKHIDGKSLLNMVYDESAEERQAYIELCGLVLPNKAFWLEGIRTPKYKFVRGAFSNSKIDPELYDLELDPREQRNILFKNKETAKLLGECIDKLKVTQEELSGEKMNAEEIAAVTKQLKNLGYF